MKNAVRKGMNILVVIIFFAHTLFSNDSYCINKADTTIYMIGENHINEECQKLSYQLREDAKKGKIILAVEGEAFNEENEFNIFGIEDFNLYCLQRVLEVYTILTLHKTIQNVISFNENDSVSINTQIMNLLKMNTNLRAIIFPYDLSFSFDTKNLVTEILSLVSHDILPFVYSDNKEILDLFASDSFDLSNIIPLTENHSLNLFKLLDHLTLLYLELAFEKNQISLDTVQQIIIYRMQFEEYLEMDEDMKRDMLTIIQDDYLNFLNVGLMILH